MEVKRIEVVKVWPEPKSIRNIEMFLRFANFYHRFVQRFSKIVVLVTLMLKIIFFPTSIDIYKKATSNSIFLTLEVKLAFLQLRQAFTEVIILYHLFIIQTEYEKLNYRF